MPATRKRVGPSRLVTIFALSSSRLTQGAAFVGDSYLHGAANEAQARALIDQAELDQRKLPPAELAARQAACASEATRLLARSNPLERAVVKRLARKRMDKLLGA